MPALECDGSGTEQRGLMHRPANQGAATDLCRRCAAGDDDAFREVYRRFGGSLYGTAWRILRNAEEAEEVVQETFLILYRKAASARPENLGAWLHRVAANRSVDRLRRRTRRGEVELFQGTHTDGGASAGADARAEAGRPAPIAGPRALGLDLERAVARLPERARTVFILHDVEGFKHREIGELMGISDGSSKSQLFRARALLRDWLTEGEVNE